MKRFLVFAGIDYEWSGGWCDFRGAFDTRSEARRAAWALDNDDRYHLVDTATGKIVETGATDGSQACDLAEELGLED